MLTNDNEQDNTTNKTWHTSHTSHTHIHHTHTYIHSHAIIYDLYKTQHLKYTSNICRGLSEKVGHAVHIRLIVKKCN